jgi:Cu/Ag efflux pump CusA
MWSGQFEYLERAGAAEDRRPVTLLIILLLYLNFRSLPKP